MWIVFHAITALESSASAEDTAASESWWPGQFQRNLADVDRALHGMDRLPTIEHVLQFGAKRRIGEVVDQVNRPE